MKKLLAIVVTLVGASIIGYGATELINSPPKAVASCDTVALINQAQDTLLQTTKSGQWYATHLGTAGFWTDSWNLLAQAKNCASPSTTTTAPITTTSPTTTTTPAGNLGANLPPRMPASNGVVSTVTTVSGIQNALNTASAGAIIQVHGGTLTGRLSSSGKRLTAAQISSSGPITITNYPGENVVLSGDSVIDNLLTFTNCRGIRIQRNKIGGSITLNAPGNLQGIKIDTCQDFEVDGLIINNMGTNNSGYGADGILVAANSLHSQTYNDNIQIWNNTIHDWGQDTRSGIGGPHGIYYGSRGNQATTVRAGAENGVIANNLIYDGQGGYGIQIGDQARNTIVTNNTIVHMEQSTHGVGSGIVVWSSGGTYGSKDNTIVNNIISNNIAYAVQASGNSVSASVVRNNLAYANSLAPPDYQPFTYSAFTVGTNLPNANPLYVNYSGKDFHLQTGSPALGKADSAYTPPFDKDGNARPASPALGAFNS